MATVRSTTGPALLARFVWMMAGPVTLALFALAMVAQHGRWLSFASLMYFPVLGVTLGARWHEFRLGEPMTATGEPATLAHLRRFVVKATLAALAVWVAANWLGGFR
jgi:hypothetical protein